jgi:hypothetical protein
MVSRVISIFTTASNPVERGDLWDQSIECYSALADQLVVVNGEHKDTYWPYEFDWPLIGQQFQRGYEMCEEDWAIHVDLDWVFHENDYGRIRQALKDYPNSPAVSMYKWQFLVPDRYNLKSRVVVAVNKKKFGDRIKFDSGGDLCQPSLDGVELNLNEVPQAGVPFYNYEKLLKTKEQIDEDVSRMDKAWQRHFGTTLYSRDDKTAYDGWLEMMLGRLQKPHAKVELGQHPKVMQDTLANLKPNQWGYDGFGLIRRNSYAEGS